MKKILIGLTAIVSLIGIYYFGVQKGTFEKLLNRNETSGKKKAQEKPSLKPVLPKEIDSKFLWRYIKNKNDRSIAMVTSRNKFNDEDISLGFRCDISSKKKALFLFGKFFSEEKDGGKVNVELNYDDTVKFQSKLDIVLNGKGLAFNKFDQLSNIQKHNRLKIGIKNSVGKNKTFIFELIGSSKSIDRVLAECN